MTDERKNPLREALDAHVPIRGGCSCGWGWVGCSLADWADHREAAVRAALEAEPATPPASAETLEPDALLVIRHLREYVNEGMVGPDHVRQQYVRDIDRLLAAHGAVVQGQNTSPADPPHPEAIEAGEIPVGLGAASSAPAAEAVEQWDWPDGTIRPVPLPPLDLPR